MRYLIFLLASEASKRVGSVVLLLSAIVGFASSASAEGSRNLITSTGGHRPFLEYRNDSSIGVPRRNVIKVYAKAGETINLGSSTTGLDADDSGPLAPATIRYRSPSGVAGACTPGVGFIANRAAEIAGPFHPVTNSSAPAFTPCTITSTIDGVWEIIFESTDPDSTDDPARVGVANNWTQDKRAFWIAAWDITVRNSAGVAQPGRAFADYLALMMGANGTANFEFYIQTQDGYGYFLDLNGLSPYGFVFFSNNKGFRDSLGNPIYRSLQLESTNSTTDFKLPSGFSVQLPNSADSIATRDYTHKIFFNTTDSPTTPKGGPDTSMPTSTLSASGTVWLLNPPKQPPTPSNLTFTGIEGTPGFAGTSPLGGNFTFQATEASAYSITLDLNTNGIYGDSIVVGGETISDRILVGTAKPGTNTVFWDGRDNNGMIVSASSKVYKARVTQYAGEIHFPIIDPENNATGLIINRLKDPGSSPGAPTNTLFFDDRYNYRYLDATKTTTNTYDYSICSADDGTANLQPIPPAATGMSCYGATPTIRQALQGISSPGHRWTGNFGDSRGMDTWAYYPSSSFETVSGFSIRQADLSITKTDNLETVAPGATLIYTIVVRNNGVSDVTNAVVKDSMPPQLTNVTWTCTASTNSSCAVVSGTGDIDTTVNLRNGGAITYTVTAIVSPSATGTIRNTATVLRPDDVNDPTDPSRTGADNNSATDSTTILSTTPNLRLVKRITALNNTAYTDIIDDPTDTNDDSSHNWTTNYLAGRTGKGVTAADTVPVKPGDSLEYTIYFLSDGATAAQNVTLCDLVPTNTTFLPNIFNNSTPKDSGTSTGDFGLRLTIDNTTVYLSNADDAPDRGRYYAPGTSAPCGNNGTSAIAPNGAITVRLNSVPNATAPGTPNSFGFIRFRARVN